MTTTINDHPMKVVTVADTGQTTINDHPMKVVVVGGDTPGPGDTAEWGDITGDLDNQADLKNVLDSKADSSDLEALDNRTSNVDNTSDIDKPVSTATQTALNSKVSKSGDTMTGALNITTGGVNLGSGTLSRLQGNNGSIQFVDVNAGAYRFHRSATGFWIGSNSALVTAQQMLHVDGNARINGIDYIVGTGFPEGVVSAPVGSIYTDTAVTNGARKWEKVTGTGNTGWQVLSGRVVKSIPLADLQNGWDYENGTEANARLTREGNLVTLTIPGIGLRGTNATANIFYTIPAGYRVSSTGNYGTIGFVSASGSSVSAITKDFNNIACAARSNVSGVLTWQTDSPWPSA